jgi:hypothetical protein
MVAFSDHATSPEIRAAEAAPAGRMPTIATTKRCTLYLWLNLFSAPGNNSARFEIESVLDLTDKFNTIASAIQ